MSESFIQSLFMQDHGLSSDETTLQLDIETVFSIRRPEVIRFLLSLGVDAVQAEDITQEVFLRALDQSEDTKPIRNLFGWLLVCAKNLAINQYRRLRREELGSPDQWRIWEATISDGIPGQEVQILQQERYQKLLCIFRSLSKQEQQCLVLRAQGVPFREIATSLNVPLRTAANITTDAISKLRVRLQKSLR